MNDTRTFDFWPSLSEFAADIGVQYGTAKAMRRRGSIPVEYWPALVAAAEKRGLAEITYETLVEAHASKSKRAA